MIDINDLTEEIIRYSGGVYSPYHLMQIWMLLHRGGFRYEPRSKEAIFKAFDELDDEGRILFKEKSKGQWRFCCPTSKTKLTLGYRKLLSSLGSTKMEDLDKICDVVQGRKERGCLSKKQREKLSFVRTSRIHSEVLSNVVVG